MTKKDLDGWYFNFDEKYFYKTFLDWEDNERVAIIRKSTYIKAWSVQIDDVDIISETTFKNAFEIANNKVKEMCSLPHGALMT